MPTSTVRRPGPVGWPGTGGLVVAHGSGIVVATGGSVVYQGDGGAVIANTGSASTGGRIEVGRSTGVPGHEDARSAAVGPHRSGLVRAALPAGETVGAAVGEAVADLEDHRVVVRGDDNRVAYDDSAIVVDRDGPVAISTGDVDSCGLNVVDVTGTVVTRPRGCCDEEVDARRAGVRVAVDDGDDGADAAVADDDADGTTLNGVRVVGDRNTVVDDDGAVVVGGAGRVSIQIGDADTSGTLVLRARRSLVGPG